MGGDGGVIASNRRYMRGAGAADHTADVQRHQQEKESLQEQMRTCHLTKAPLVFSESIVACPYGRLYSKEAAVEALLRRGNELGSHIRGLKDLADVHFHLVGNVPTCPVTGVELNGRHAAFLIVSKNKKDSTNVLSERALKEMGIDGLQEDFGPFQKEDMIRLAPPESMMDEIREELTKKRQMEKSAKKKKDGKKRKMKQTDEQRKHKALKSSGGGGSVADAARQRVASAVASNDVLSSLFTSKNEASITEKEKNDNLFAR